MQAALGRKGDYSVRAVLHLARHRGEGRQKARVIAAAMEIPDRYATQILANLVGAGLLTAAAGPDGGYELARDPEQISLLQVVEAAEGPIRLDRCVLRGGSCDWTTACPLHAAWSRAQDAMIRVLAATSFAELAHIDAEMVAGTYQLTGEEPAHPFTVRRGGRGNDGPDR